MNIINSTTAKKILSRNRHTAIDNRSGERVTLPKGFLISQNSTGRTALVISAEAKVPTYRFPFRGTRSKYAPHVGKKQLSKA